MLLISEMMLLSLIKLSRLVQEEVALFLPFPLDSVMAVSAQGMILQEAKEAIRYSDLVRRSQSLLFSTHVVNYVSTRGILEALWWYTKVCLHSH